MLEICCKQYKEKVESGFNDQEKQNLNTFLEYLENYGSGKFVCKLFSDFCKNSFYFELYKDNKFFMNGGLIYNNGEYSVHT